MTGKPKAPKDPAVENRTVKAEAAAKATQLKREAEEKKRYQQATVENARRERDALLTKNEVRTPEHMLAICGSGTMLEKNDPQVTAFGLVLDQLERKCTNSRVQIGDITVTAWQLLKSRHRDDPVGSHHESGTLHPCP